MKKTTEFKKFTASDGHEICFPIATVEGAFPGPKLVVTAGIHGCEYPGIAGAIAAFKEIDPAEVHGTITIVTITSVAAFEARCMFVTPYDRKNPCRTFPGAEKGTYTEEFDYILFNEIIKGNDYHLDMHGGDMVEALVPFTLYHANDNEYVTNKSREMALAYRLPALCATRSNGGWSDNGSNYSNSAEHGIPSIITEVGGCGLMKPEDIQTHKNGVFNLLKYLKMIPGEVTVSEEGIEEFSSFEWLYSPVKGIYYPNCKVGNYLEKGQSVGVMEDYFGNVLMELKSPANGRILFLETSPAIAENGLIMGIGAR